MKFRSGLMTFLVCVPSLVQAADLPSRSAPPAPPQFAPVPIFVQNAILGVNNQFRLDFADRYLDYGEHGNVKQGEAPGLIDSERGWIPGLTASVSVMRDVVVSNAYFEGAVSWNDGQSRYAGSFSGLPQAYGDLKQSHDAEMADVDLRFGKGFALAPWAMLTPYVGVGAHDWVRDSSKSEGGYKEEYRNGYAGAGLMLQMSPFSQFVVSASGLVGSTFAPSLRATRLPGGIAPFSVDLGKSAIYKLGLSGDYALTERFHVNAGVDYTNFDYGESKTLGNGLFEPDSRTSDTRLKVGFGYAY